MEMLPQVETISTLKNNQEAVLSKVKDRPVLLLQHSKPLAVMVTPEQWDWTAQELQMLKKRVRDLELLLEARRISVQMDADPASVVKLEDLEKRLATHADVQCSREASNYITDSWPYTPQPVLAALIALRTSDPLPGQEIETGVYRWETAGHLIVYERKQLNLRVLIIKPGENL